MLDDPKLAGLTHNGALTIARDRSSFGPFPAQRPPYPGWTPYCMRCVTFAGDSTAFVRTVARPWGFECDVHHVPIGWDMARRVGPFALDPVPAP